MPTATEEFGRQVLRFQYIATHENKEFDYPAVAKELKLSEDELVSYLFALERAGKIKVTPRYLARKPIVISASDRKWYFHRVTLPHTEVPVPPFQGTVNRR